MICERCGASVDVGRIVIRRTFAGFACYSCAEGVKRIEWEERVMTKKNGNGKSKKAGPPAAKAKAAAKATKPQGAKKGGSLAAIIDPLLPAGGHTTQEIAAELAKKGGEAAKGKDLAANVRARMVSYTRKGWQVVARHGAVRGMRVHDDPAGDGEEDRPAILLLPLRLGQ